MKPENESQPIKPRSWLRRNAGRILIATAVVSAGIGADRIIVSNSNKPDNPPGIEVPSTYTETVDQAAQAALDQIINKEYSATDYPPPNTSFIISEAMFQATNNGTTVSDSQLSTLLDSAVKSFDENTLTADVSLLFPVGNPGNQVITVDKVANTDRGINIDGKIGIGVSVDWDTVLTIPNKGSELVMPLNAKVYRIALPQTYNKNY